MKHRLVIIFICMVLFYSYLVLMGIYLLPQNPATIKTKHKVTGLMNGLFYQDWRLFAPDPVHRATKMYIRCKGPESDWSDWFNPIEKLQKKHEKRRFSLKGLYYRHYNYIVTSFRSSYSFTNSRSIQKTKFFNKLKKLSMRFSGDICLYKIQTTPVTVEFKIFDFHPTQYSEREAKKPLRVYTAQKFGPYSYK